VKKRRFIKLFFLVFLITSWLLSGWPIIWQNPRIPPKIKEIKAATNTETFTTAGTTNWTAPPGVTSVDVEAWGGGGGGANRTSSRVGGGGGGGGAYAKKAGVAVTAGTSYSYTVGAAGVGGATPGAGGASSFNTNVVVAAGGTNATANSATGGVGGTVAASTGDAGSVFAGGRGYTWSSGSYGAGGGGSGGTAVAGNNTAATNATTYTGASAVAGGGPGGNGANGAGNGSAPASGPGGGGGGAYRNTSGTRNGGAGYAGQIRLTYTIYTVLGNGTDGGNASIGPGGAATEIDRFSLVESVGTDTVTDLTVTLGPTDAFNNVATVDVQTTGSVSKCSTSSITSNTVSLSSCGIAVTTTLTEYKIIITPKTHGNMPAVPGASYATTATVTGLTCTNTVTGTDSGSATVTIDNASPANVSSASGTATIGQVSFSWTNPGDSDFSQSVVLRRADSAVGDTPVEGTTYSVGNTIGSSTVACIVNSPTASCIDSGLATGTYNYKIFAKDTNNNYSQNGAVPTNSPFSVTGVIISVTITSTANNPFDYGIVALSGTKSTVDLSKTQTAQNNGNIPENFKIKTSNATGGTQWTLGSSPGSNVFVHEYSTNSGGAWTKFTTADTYETTPLVTNVAVSGTQNFDLRITLPSGTTDYQQKAVTITLMAEAY
jgi:hypothetical protein